ncbi:uncharacterized protein E0L32_011082 [Thyridium curvatum]|uniref:Ig-like domain-containing protein n=1 Tax=Thyridium curvatum TaxID=1093900 RepID=A0A507ALK3_9PEZI|nr:uncharacterized protein E0L32_011082 [Thyridium curvatum]TPX07014.1 hypothetical protein E0L32_011082 [Thyridium curvatum]
MQFFTVATTVLLAGLAAARPNTQERRAGGPAVADLTFWAAAENTYVQAIPIDGQDHAINNGLSFTRISSDAPSSVTCVASGIDGSKTWLVGPAKDVPIGPPQVQTSARCFYH